MDVETLVQMRVVAEELRRVRQNPPKTIGAALPAYATAIRNARRKGVEPALLLVLGEILWTSIRPEEEPTPDAIGIELEALWKKYLDDLAFCAPRRVQ